MKKSLYTILGLIILAGVATVIALTKKPLPETCTDQPPGTEQTVPVITSLSAYSGSVGSHLEIHGCNFAGFEGDKNAWIKNTQGMAGIMYGEQGSTSKLIKITLQSPLCRRASTYSGLPCPAQIDLTPGQYKIFVNPWGTPSNEVNFTIK